MEMQHGELTLVFFSAELGTNETTFVQPSHRTVVYPWYTIEPQEFSVNGRNEWMENEDDRIA
jgi:hypothetical protein